jgi:hypothetical protein
MLKVDMKVKTKVGKTLQLDKKWIRLMLTLSIVAIIGLSIYPNGGMMKSKEAMESVPMHRLERLSVPEMYITDDSTIVYEEAPAASQEPIEVKIVKNADKDVI